MLTVASNCRKKNPPTHLKTGNSPDAKTYHRRLDGTRFDLDVDQGSTVMENAVRNSVPGIEAECGGACACATCHVYVDEEWTEKVGQPEAMEEDMLDFAFDVRPTSRLSCQIPNEGHL